MTALFDSPAFFSFNMTANGRPVPNLSSLPFEIYDQIYLYLDGPVDDSTCLKRDNGRDAIGVWLKMRGFRGCCPWMAQYCVSKFADEVKK